MLSGCAAPSFAAGAAIFSLVPSAAIGPSPG
jgi:hypothetical protein